MKKIKMVRVGLDVDSSYPEYSYEVETETHKIPAYRMQVQVSEDVIERWDKASKAYAEMQAEIASLMNPTKRDT